MILFFANRGSRVGSESFQEAVDALQVAGIVLTRSEAFDDPERFRAAIQAGVASKAEMIIVGGGDGTASMAADLIRGSETILGLIPLGTGNQFARDLLIPIDLQEAILVIAQGVTTNVDVTELNGLGFVNVATIGLTNDIASQLTLKKELGRAAYVPAAIKALGRMQSFSAIIERGGETTIFEAIQLVVANGRTHAGPLPVSTNASITDGLIDVYAIPPLSTPGTLAALAMLPFGGHTDRAEIESFQANSFVLTTDPKLPITVDGEVTWFDRMEFTMFPAQLKVRVPQSFADSMNDDLD